MVAVSTHWLKVWNNPFLLLYIAHSSETVNFCTCVRTNESLPRLLPLIKNQYMPKNGKGSITKIKISSNK